MIADYFAKPLQGLMYRKMRDIIMDVTPFLVEDFIEKETKNLPEHNARPILSNRWNNLVNRVISVKLVRPVTKNELVIQVTKKIILTTVEN